MSFGWLLVHVYGRGESCECYSEFIKLLVPYCYLQLWPIITTTEVLTYEFRHILAYTSMICKYAQGCHNLVTVSNLLLHLQPSHNLVTSTTQLGDNLVTQACCNHSYTIILWVNEFVNSNICTSTSPSISLSRVDLPAPFGPTNAILDSRSIPKSMLL